VRIAMICVVIILGTSAINALREGEQFPLSQVLPGCGGPDRPLVYQLGGVAVLGLLLWGLGRVFGKGDD